LHAFALLVPAATANVTPAVTALVTALFSAVLKPPPNDMLATAGFTAFARTQSMPAMTWLYEPLPAQFSTRTATRLTALATPYSPPPTVPATCVPWPLQSCPFCPSPMKSAPTEARPPNSLCPVRMPVSTI
jgi:hypothetical protein